MSDKFPISPYLREFVYDILYKATEDEKERLKGKYYKLRKKNIHAKRFCDTANLDQILLLLSDLGIEWSLILWDNKKKPKYIRDVFNKFDDSNRGTEIKEIIQKRMYLTSSPQFLNAVGTASKLLQSNIYRQNSELLRAGYHLRKWPVKLGTPVAEEMEDGLDSLRYIATTVLSCFFVNRNTDMIEEDIFVLLYAYSFQHIYVTHQDAGKKFLNVMSRYKFQQSLKRLFAEEMLQKHFKEKSFTITAYGISKCLKIINDVLSLNRFQ